MSPQPTKRERKDAAREARLQQEQAESSRAARTRRLQILVGVVAGVIAVIAAIAIATGGGKSKKPPASVAGVANTKAFVGGLKQKGNALGDPKAPVTLVEYVDLQCPICKEYSQQVMPTIVDKYVRTGKVRLEQQVVAILGPGSVKAQGFAATTVAQNRLWSFTHLFYENQGEENSGYVTNAFLNKIAAATPGLSAKQADAAVGSAPAQKLVDAADAAGVNSTPTFKIGTSGGTLTEINIAGGPQAILDAIDARTK
jgi:protein-disulfide isomerase